MLEACPYTVDGAYKTKLYNCSCCFYLLLSENQAKKDQVARTWSKHARLVSMTFNQILKYTLSELCNIYKNAHMMAQHDAQRVLAITSAAGCEVKCPSCYRSHRSCVSFDELSLLFSAISVLSSYLSVLCTSSPFTSIFCYKPSANSIAHGNNWQGHYTPSVSQCKGLFIAEMSNIVVHVGDLIIKVTKYSLLKCKTFLLMWVIWL